MKRDFVALNRKETLEKIKNLGMPVRLLVDFSALGHRVAYSCFKDLVAVGFIDWKAWKVKFLDHVLSLKQQLNSKNGVEVIICCDQKVNGNYWRMNIYSEYKKMRYLQKEQIPRELMNKNFTDFQKELYDCFPFKVISIPGAEGDDVIAVLGRDSKYANIIMSSDFDLYQITDNQTNFMFSLNKDAFVDGGNAKSYLIEKICGGDSSDNIPNISSDLDAISDPLKRQKRFTAKRMDCMLDVFVKEGEEVLVSQLEGTEKLRYLENKSLMDLTKIPKEISENIRIAYENYHMVGNPKLTWQYCFNNNIDKECTNRIVAGVMP